MRAQWAGLPCGSAEPAIAAKLGPVSPQEEQEPTSGTAKRRRLFGRSVLQLARGDELLLEVAHVGVVVAELVLDTRHLDGINDRCVVQLVAHHDIFLAQERLRV